MILGHRNKLQRLEHSERQLNWMIYSSFGDPKKMPKSMQQWWPIEGEPKPKFKSISRAKIVKLDTLFRNLGKKKDG